MRTSRCRSLVRLLILLGLQLPSLGLRACTDGGPPRTKATTIALTDGPFPYHDVARADIHIVSIAMEGADLGGAPRTFLTPDRTVNVLELTGGRTVDLGEAVLDPGQHTLWLTIDPTRSSITLADGTVLTGSSSPGIRWGLSGTPANPEFRFATTPPIQVTTEGMVIVLDFNVGRAFQPLYPAQPSLGFRFFYTSFGGPIGAPIHAIDRDLSGSVSGTVRATAGGATADAAVELLAPDALRPDNESAWAVAGTARTDASGNFRIAYVTPGLYVLVADAPLDSPDGKARLLGVSVSTGTETAVGTVLLPLAPLPNTVAGTYVVRRVGLPGIARAVPTLISPAPPTLPLESTSLIADTLVLDATGAGTEVRVENRSSFNDPIGVRVITRTALTYTVQGRIVRLSYPCPGTLCTAAPVGVLDGAWMTVYLLPSADLIGWAWPRAFEQVRP
jgi:hypothetical protein